MIILFFIFFSLSDPTFFPGRAATIYFRPPPEGHQAGKGHSTIQTIKRTIQQSPLLDSTSGDIEIGLLGILHPSVLEKFEISYPCSALEFTLEPFKKEMHTVWTNAD